MLFGLVFDGADALNMGEYEEPSIGSMLGSIGPRARFPGPWWISCALKRFMTILIDLVGLLDRNQNKE